MFEHKSFLHFVEHCNATKQDIVALTIVETKGSTYRKPGTTMLVSSNHESVGVLSGGCIEEAMMHCCDEVLKQHYGKLVTHDLRLPDDSKESWEVGVGCNGLIQVWLEPFYVDEVYGALGEAVIYAKEGIAQTLIRSTQKEKSGEYRFIDSDVDFSFHYDEKHYCVSQAIKPLYKIFILGVGSAAQALVDIANILGWEVTLGDTRKESLAEIKNADHKHWFESSLDIQKVLVGQHFDAAVIMSHEFKNDSVYVKELIKSNISYVGLLGSKKRTQKIIEIVQSNNVYLDERFHAPVGLDIGAQTPQSIALSICAEIEAKRNNKVGLSLGEQHANV